MIKKNKLHTFWPVIIGEFYNPEHSLIKKDLINFLKEYEQKNPIQQHDDNKDYHTNFNLYESKYNLQAEKNDALQKVLKFIGISILETIKLASQSKIKELKEKKSKLNINLYASWFIRYNQGGMVYPHNHGECSWSCVYYVQADKEPTTMNGSTYFIKPYLAQKTTDFGGNYMATDQFSMNAEEGKLIIFPGYLYHGSRAYVGENDRIIISANTKTDLIV